jgi:anaerobic selenocysteine-containing dehydrogenase
MPEMNAEIKEIFTDCTLCYHSCGTKVTVKNGKAIKVEGQKSHPINKGELCPKGEAMLSNIYSPDRLKSPLKRVDGKFVEISWDQALDEIAAKLNQLKNDFGPQTLGVFSGSIGVENLEMAGLTQRFKAAFGSPNFFSVESVCYRMRIRTRQITFGKYPTEELNSKLYILWGHNPDASDFPLKLALEENLPKGAKLVVIDPRRIPLADRADKYLRIRPGTDGAMAMAMIHVIIKENLVDHEFVSKNTIGTKNWSTTSNPLRPNGPRQSPGFPPKKFEIWPGSLPAPKGQASTRGPAPRIRPPVECKTAGHSRSCRSSQAISTCLAVG